MTTAQAYTNYQWRRMAYETRKRTAAERFGAPVRANKRTMFGAVLAAFDYLTRL